MPTTTINIDASSKVNKNSAITGATKTKITYDSKGLVTSGADATTADIASSTDKRYLTDAQLVVVGNTSGTNTGDQDLSSYATKTGTETLTNKRIDPRIQTVTSSATVTPNADSNDLVVITAQAEALSLVNPSGTPVQGQPMIIRIKDNGTARAITYDTQYRAIGVTLPTTTVISKTHYLGMIYNSTDTKWDIVGVNSQA